MVVYRSHDTAGSLAHGVFISRPTGNMTHWQNPDPLGKSRRTGKIQTHWLGHNVIYIVTRNIKKLYLVFINILFIYINLIKHSKDLQSCVIWLGSQLEESFLIQLSTIWFSLKPHMTVWPWFSRSKALPCYTRIYSPDINYILVIH